jgi:hypothetical protein
LRGTIAKWVGALIVLIIAGGCGTDVDVGRNDNPELFADTEAESGDVISPADGAPANSADGLALNCTEAVSEAELPVHAKAFCAETPQEFRQPFARAFERLCVQRDIVRMMDAQCSWDGSSKLDAFFRVLEKTDLKDRSVMDFSMLAAFAVTIPRTPDEYLFAFYKGYEDPEFKARLKRLDAFKLSNVMVDRNAGLIEYNVEAQTSAATAKFRGRIAVHKLSSGVIAIYDQAVADKVIVKEQRYLILLVPIGEKKSIVLAVDDKIVEDLGNHQIAYSTSVKINKERMELTNAVANYQGEAK